MISSVYKEKACDFDRFVAVIQYRGFEHFLRKTVIDCVDSGYTSNELHSGYFTRITMLHT